MLSRISLPEKRHRNDKRLCFCFVVGFWWKGSWFFEWGFVGVLCGCSERCEVKGKRKRLCEVREVRFVVSRLKGGKEGGWFWWRVVCKEEEIWRNGGEGGVVTNGCYCQWLMVRWRGITTEGAHGGQNGSERVVMKLMWGQKGKEGVSVLCVGDVTPQILVIIIFLLFWYFYY